jgi:peptide-methionine (S)-S-oxide reductase
LREELSRVRPSRDGESATLGGGCLWCTEAVFLGLKGVVKVESGYSGGTAANPSYEQVCMGGTGHAEVVQVTFDPEVISYRQVLQVFFTVHDPTTPDRQGNDVGPQYRSVIFYHNEEQKREAERVMKEVNESKIWSRPLVTELVPFEVFYKAEEYHQEYFKKNPWQPYCQVIIAPKVAKFRKRYLDMLMK